MHYDSVIIIACFLLQYTLLKSNFNYNNNKKSVDQWLQSSLPVREEGLGVRSVVSLAPSVFLASAVSTRPLQQEILPFFFQFPDVTFDCCLARWSELTSAAPVDGPTATRQRLWDAHMVGVMRQRLMSVCCSDLDRAQILAVSAPHSGDWLHAIPCTNCGLILENEELQVALCDCMRPSRLFMRHESRCVGPTWFFLQEGHWETYQAQSPQ